MQNAIYKTITPLRVTLSLLFLQSLTLCYYLSTHSKNDSCFQENNEQENSYDSNFAVLAFPGIWFSFVFISFLYLTLNKTDKKNLKEKQPEVKEKNFYKRIISEEEKKLEEKRKYDLHIYQGRF